MGTRHIITTTRSGGALAATIALAATTAHAGTYHDLSGNHQPCADCHTLHYSENGQPLETESGGPFAKLALRSTTNKLCLFCHDGSDPKAPDVIGPVTMYAASGDEHSGAGFFANSGGTASSTGHDLGVEAAVVPFSSRANVTLTCASCHDPHGTPNYRNILTAPADGTGVAAQMARDVYRNAAPGDPPSTAATVSAYRESNEGYQAATSAWCAECHDELKSTANKPGARVHHFTDVPINGGGYPTAPGHWQAGTGSGFGTTTGDATEGVPRLRFQVAGATDYASARVVEPSNQVTCASCHLAHGGNHEKGLVWPYADSGAPADANSGCQQCHDF